MRNTAAITLADFSLIPITPGNTNGSIETGCSLNNLIDLPKQIVPESNHHALIIRIANKVLQ
jgi:hypothetical protein